MTTQSELLAWAEGHAYYEEGFPGKHHSPEVCHHMNTLDKRVRGKCACEWVSPYGFVPEADCLEHDTPTVT